MPYRLCFVYFDRCSTRDACPLAPGTGSNSERGTTHPNGSLSSFDSDVTQSIFFFFYFFSFSFLPFCVMFTRGVAPIRKGTAKNVQLA